MKTKIFAHRGASGRYPENTILAFQKGLSEGADGIELDVHLSRDGVAMVIHDETVDRTTNGSGFIKDYTASTLQKLNAGGWKYSLETIPTLDQVLEWLAPAGLLLNIELKNNIFPYPDMPRVVADSLSKAGMTDRTIISSFNHPSLLDVKKTDPALQTALLYKKPIAEPWAAANRYQADGIHPHYRAVNRNLIMEMHRRNLAVRPYTVNSKVMLTKFTSWQSDAIITDYPSRAFEEINGK